MGNAPLPTAVLGSSPFSRGCGQQEAGSEGKVARERQFRWAQGQGAFSISISRVGEP